MARLKSAATRNAVRPVPTAELQPPSPPPPASSPSPLPEAEQAAVETEPQLSNRPQPVQPAKRRRRATIERTGDIEDLTLGDNPDESAHPEKEHSERGVEEETQHEEGSLEPVQAPSPPKRKKKRPSQPEAKQSKPPSRKLPASSTSKQVPIPSRAKGKRIISESSSTESNLNLSSESDNDSSRESAPPPKKTKKTRAGMQGGRSHFRPRANLQFNNTEHATRYTSLLNAQFVSARSLHVPTLNALNVREEVFNFLFNIGWMKFVTFNQPIFDALTLEFYSSFNFDMRKANFSVREPCITFQLFGVLHNLSISQFTSALGLMSTDLIASQDFDNLLCDYPDDFNASLVFNQLCADDSVEFKPGKSKANLIISPALRLIHRFLAYTYSGRNDDTTVITKAELFFLWCMENRKAVNIGYWIALKFKKLVNNPKKLYLGSYITALAVNLHNFDVQNNNFCKVADMLLLDIRMLCEMRLIAKGEDGTYSFVDAGKLHDASTSTRAAIPSVPSTSQTPPAAANEIQHLQDSIDSLTRMVQQIQTQIQAWFAHVGFEPPTPPP